MKKFLFYFLVILSLSACGGIKSYFPDKEKEYQLTSEIPDLVVPDDLSEQAIKPRVVIENEPVLRQPKASLTEPDIHKDETKAIYVELVEFSGGATRIRIEDSLTRIWRTVGKALSRNSIEIIDRNDLEYVYSVRYDPDFKAVEDGSLWDEALFIFGSDPAKDKEFRVRLVENGGLTEVLVLDKKDVPLSKGNGLKLLKLLYKTVKEDLANTN